MRNAFLFAHIGSCADTGLGPFVHGLGNLQQTTCGIAGGEQAWNGRRHVFIDEDMRARKGRPDFTGQVRTSCHTTGDKYTGRFNLAAIRQTDCRYAVRTFYGLYGLGAYSQPFRYTGRRIAAISAKCD